MFPSPLTTAARTVASPSWISASTTPGCPPGLRTILNASGSGLRPDFISYKLADTGNPSVWLNHYLYRIPMAVWTLRNQKVYKTARNKYDMYIFEGFSVK